MRFDDSPKADQELLAVFRRWFRDHADLNLTAIEPSALEAQSLEDWWRQIVMLGWTSLRLPESLGGIQADCSQLCSLMEAAGEAISPMPLMENNLAVELLSACPASASRNEAIKDASVGKIALGVEQFLSNKLPILKPSSGGSGSWVLSGQILLDCKPAKANSVLLLAHIDCSESTRNEKAVIYLPADHALHSLRPAGRRLDGRTLVELNFEDRFVPHEALVAEGIQGLSAINRAVSMGRLMLCAEAYGIARRLLELTVVHLRSRWQFGQPLGKFQALQHRAADMLMSVTYARDLTWDTVANICAHEAKENQNGQWLSEMHRGVMKTQLEVMRNATLVAKHAIQLHGGMGVSEELPISHAFRRLVVIEKLLGSRSYLLSELIKPEI